MSDDEVIRMWPHTLELWSRYAKTISGIRCPRERSGRLCEPYQTALLATSDNTRKRAIRIAHARHHGRHTKEQWQVLCAELSWCCARCGDPLGASPQKDHAVPVYQGGSDSIDNLQPLCQRCNTSKGPEAVNYVKRIRESYV